MQLIMGKQKISLKFTSYLFILTWIISFGVLSNSYAKETSAEKLKTFNYCDDCLIFDGNLSRSKFEDMQLNDVNFVNTKINNSKFNNSKFENVSFWFSEIKNTQIISSSNSYKNYFYYSFLNFLFY